jgi:septum formation protein
VQLVLASASPRRAELLRAAGIAFEVIPAAVDESLEAGETAEQYVRRLAESKAEAVRARADGRVVLGADTIVVVHDEILGKPVDNADAARMLRLLSGREHTVMTGVCLIAPEPAKAGPHDRQAPHDQYVGAGFSRLITVDVARTTVVFEALTDEEIAWYVATGEPADKAGAYAIQGLASRFVTRIDGSYSNVVGLPVDLVYRLCKGAGLLIS